MVYCQGNYYEQYVRRSVLKRRTLFFLLILCLLLLIPGCSDTPPVSFQSVLNIEPDESGERTITASFSKSTLSSVFGNKNTSFQTFLTINCPETIQWDYLETGSSYELTFTIPFANLEEYQAKVSHLTGVSGCVTVTRPQSGMKTGFTLKESTDTLALFSWLISALEERTAMNSSRLATLFLNGSNELCYAGIDHPQEETGLYIYAETLFDAESVDILTELTLDNSWNRTIRIHFPDELLDNASNVKPYLSSLLPESVSESWEKDTTWVLSFPVCTQTELAALMDSFFQAEDKKSFSEVISAKNATLFEHKYSESINVAFFVPNTGATTVRYFVKGTAGAQLSVAEGIDASAAMNTSYPDYTCLHERRLAEGTFEFTASYQYQPSEILVDTRIRSSQDVRRTITLDLGSRLPDVHRKLMFSTFKATADDHGITTEQLTDTSYRLIWYQTGTLESINNGLKAVFGGSSALTYQKETGGVFDRKKQAFLSDSADIRAFLADPARTVISCTLRFPNGETLADGADSITWLSSDGTWQISGTTSRTNYLRYWMFALDVFVGLFLFYLFVNGPVRSYIGYRRRMNRKTAAHSGSNGKSRKTQQKRGR